MNENGATITRRDLLKLGLGAMVGLTLGSGVANKDSEQQVVDPEANFLRVDAQRNYRVLLDYLNPNQNAQLWQDAFDAAQPFEDGKRSKFHKFYSTNDLATTNILSVHYKSDNSDGEHTGVSVDITEPDGFKQKSTEVRIEFIYPGVQDINKLKENALGFFKLPNSVIGAEWETYDPKNDISLGQYKKVKDITGNEWVLFAIEYDENMVDSDTNKEIHRSRIGLIRQYPTDTAPQYFIPTPIIDNKS